jgi:hypothetical protein
MRARRNIDRTVGRGNAAAKLRFRLLTPSATDPADTVGIEIRGLSHELPRRVAFIQIFPRARQVLNLVWFPCAVDSLLSDARDQLHARRQEYFGRIREICPV